MSLPSIHPNVTTFKRGLIEGSSSQYSSHCGSRFLCSIQYTFYSYFSVGNVEEEDDDEEEDVDNVIDDMIIDVESDETVRWTLHRSNFAHVKVEQ